MASAGASTLPDLRFGPVPLSVIRYSQCSWESVPDRMAQKTGVTLDFSQDAAGVRRDARFSLPSTR